MIEELGFAGAVIIGAGMMLRWIMTRVSRMSEDYRRLVENHLKHNTEALIELRNTLSLLNETLRK